LAAGWFWESRKEEFDSKLFLTFVYHLYSDDSLKMKKQRNAVESKESNAREKLDFWNSKIYGLSVVSIILTIGFLLTGFVYILSQQVAAGVLSFLFLIVLIMRDIMPKKFTQGGVWQAVKELLFAALWALAFWFLLSFVLSTSSPVDVVTSCSMLPILQRGDLLLLQGGAVNAQTFYFNSSFPTIDLLKKQCSEYKNGVFNSYVQCTYGVSVNNQTFLSNSSDNVIVYAANPSYYGFIVHRVFLKLVNQSDGNIFYLTKGDNNPVLDQEAGVSIVNQSSVVGRVVFDAPYIGYLKLLLFMQFSQPEGCDTIINYS
jgi:signal peptidase I